MTGNAGVYHPHMVVPKGTVEVYVGGGQPAFYAGSVMATVEITEGGSRAPTRARTENE